MLLDSILGTTNLAPHILQCFTMLYSAKCRGKMAPLLNDLVGKHHFHTLSPASLNTSRETGSRIRKWMNRKVTTKSGG